jgi:hypothetical protein
MAGPIRMPRILSDDTQGASAVDRLGWHRPGGKA